MYVLYIYMEKDVYLNSNVNYELNKSRLPYNCSEYINMPTFT